ncbi:MAG TPA: NAD-dependent epimerase/dehydratase family protein, partial [Gammaproteobacteria bacterium]|nr:NAD-dependent epimerase/dehydratase family protein [Gammaproteobacteria bacterium]
MRVLITGATGFIGSVLARTCRSRGFDVRALGQVNNDVERERAADLAADGIDVSSLDLSAGAQLDEQLVNVDVVFHLAAAQHEMNVPDSHFWNVNVEGTRRLLDSSARTGVRRFVHGSTIGVYGEGSLDASEIDESTEPAPVNIYGVTKLAGERVVLEHTGRPEVSVVRISETYGPGDRRLLKLFRAIKSGRFLLIGRCANIHQPIYVDDLVDVLLLAASDAAANGGVFVASGREKLTTQEMCEAVARALGVSLRGFRLPMTPFLAAAVVL